MGTTKPGEAGSDAGADDGLGFFRQILVCQQSFPGERCERWAKPRLDFWTGLILERERRRDLRQLVVINRAFAGGEAAEALCDSLQEQADGATSGMPGGRMATKGRSGYTYEPPGLGRIARNDPDDAG